MFIHLFLLLHPCLLLIFKVLGIKKKQTTMLRFWETSKAMESGGMWRQEGWQPQVKREEPLSIRGPSLLPWGSTQKTKRPFLPKSTKQRGQEGDTEKS